MKDATISELYYLTHTIDAKIVERKKYTCEVLRLFKSFIF